MTTPSITELCQLGFTIRAAHRDQQEYVRIPLRLAEQLLALAQAADAQAVTVPPGQGEFEDSLDRA